MPTDLRFRPSSYTPIPNLEIPLTFDGIPLCFEKIFVGPNPYQDEAADSVKMLLDHEGIKNVEVIKSRIPYRDLGIHK